MSFRDYVPTGRELFYFAIWLVLIGALVFGAFRWNEAVERSRRLRIRETPMLSGKIRQTVPIPMSRPTVTGRIPVGAGSVGVMPTSPGGGGSGGLNTRHEVPGDARVINPAELAYLKRLLAAAAIRGQARHPTNLEPAEELAYGAYRIRYVPGNDGWVLPEEFFARGYGDCQAKTLWLAVRLLEAGYREVGIRLGCRPGYIPGEPGHVWPVLNFQGQEYVFEPTASGRPYAPYEAPTRNFTVTAEVLQAPESDGRSRR